jgi:hypothetical protein
MAASNMTLKPLVLSKPKCIERANSRADANRFALGCGAGKLG